MSDIKRGDLVMVIHAACKHTQRILGAVFKVNGVEGPYATASCVECRTLWQRITGQHAIKERNTHVLLGLGGWRVPALWVIKIDPPALPETTDTGREVTA